MTKLPPLDLSEASLSLVAPAIVAERSKTRAVKERSKDQMTLDSLVQKAYDKWVEAGRPEKFSDRPGGAIRVPEDQLLRVTKALHMSGSFLNMSVRFGNTVVADGYAEVVFTAVAKTAKLATGLQPVPEVPF